MSPLAQEMLDDLATEFTDGASILMLREWFGETVTTLRRTLAELRDAGEIHERKGRYYLGSGAPVGGPHRSYTVRA